MKRYILILLLTTIMSGLSAQNCTLRLHLPASPQFIGDEFFIEIWMDVLEYPGGDPTLNNGIIGIEFDPAVMTPIKTDGPIPLQRWAWNMNQMFDDYYCIPAEAYPSPGDLRFVIYGTTAGGMDPFLYGGMPFHLWDLKFIYNGGNIILDFHEETYWDEYEMTLIGCSPGVGIENNINPDLKIWSNDQKIYIQSTEINGNIVVFNMMGQEVLSTEAKLGLNVIPVNCKNTYYFVKVFNSNFNKTSKIYVD